MRNRVSYEAVHIHTIGDDGKIVEHRAIRDDLKFMYQLGLVKPVSSEYEPFPKRMEGSSVKEFLTIGHRSLM
jgi:hypothetical protein